MQRVQQKKDFFNYFRFNNLPTRQPPITKNEKRMASNHNNSQQQNNEPVGANAEIMAVDLPANRTRVVFIFVLLVVFSIEHVFRLFY